jgi:probable lipoprotein NlpC
VAPLRPVLLLLAAALGGCAGTSLSVRQALDRTDLQARLAARGASLMGQGRERFQVAGETFNGDCSGFVEAVYALEGIQLRRILQTAAPHQTSAVAAAWEASGRLGARWRGGEWPSPGDLVFFDDTWDRNGNGRRDDPFTHVGLVEWVDVDGTVTFLHRGGQGVTRGQLNLRRPDKARTAEGRAINSFLRLRTSASDDGPALAGQLFAGFGRLGIDGAAGP